MRGQAGLEYAAMVAIAIAIMVPIWLYASGSMASAKAELQSSYARQLVNKVSNAADAVFVQGEPAQLTLFVEFPEGLTSATVAGNEVSFRLVTAAGPTDVYAVSLANLSGSLSTRPGKHRVVVKASGGAVTVSEGD